MTLLAFGTTARPDVATHLPELHATLRRDERWRTTQLRQLASEEALFAADQPADEIAEVLSGAARTSLAEIQAALERIADDVYGSCEDCKGEISLERLQARPAAPLCVHCQKRHEAHTRKQRTAELWSR